MTGNDYLNAQYSRWYSTKKVLELKKLYEEEHGFEYDFVMTTRFDLAWQKDILFDKLDRKKFYACRYCYHMGGMKAVQYWHRREKYPIGTRFTRSYKGYPHDKKGLWDVWFIGNSNVMDSFGTIYDNLEHFCKDRRMAKTKGQHAVVVSHHVLPLLWLESKDWLSKVS